jgi:hypothetical protein
MKAIALSRCALESAKWLAFGYSDAKHLFGWNTPPPQEHVA